MLFTYLSFEGVALACPGSATDVIRGLGRRPWCALGMLAGSKQGLARGWWYVRRASADFGGLRLAGRYGRSGIFFGAVALVLEGFRLKTCSPPMPQRQKKWPIDPAALHPSWGAGTWGAGELGPVVCVSFRLLVSLGMLEFYGAADAR